MSKSAHLKNITEEQRKEMQEKSRISRELKREAGEKLFQAFKDKNYWKELHSKYGLRMPQSSIPNTEVKYLKRVCKKLDIDYKEYLSDCGVTTFKQIVAMNPDWPAYAETSLLLEYWDEKNA